MADPENSKEVMRQNGLIIIKTILELDDANFSSIVEKISSDLNVSLTFFNYIL